MTDEVNTFMFEGHDTVATNISFCLYMLSKHPKQMKKVQKEVDKILSDNETTISYQDLSRKSGSLSQFLHII